MQPIEVKFRTVFVENGIWLQNFMDFVKVEEIMKEFKLVPSGDKLTFFLVLVVLVAEWR